MSIWQAWASQGPRTQLPSIRTGLVPAMTLGLPFLMIPPVLARKFSGLPTFKLHTKSIKITGANPWCLNAIPIRTTRLMEVVLLIASAILLHMAKTSILISKHWNRKMPTRSSSIAISNHSNSSASLLPTTLSSIQINGLVPVLLQAWPRRPLAEKDDGAAEIARRHAVHDRN
jgi:hypothetical protein